LFYCLRASALAPIYPIESIVLEGSKERFGYKFSWSAMFSA
jgi:hypothetical protein